MDRMSRFAKGATAARQSYPAVTVVSPSACCAPARALQGKVLLAEEAPLLPLEDCTMPERCRCRFSKQPDRRNGQEERRFPYIGQRASWFTAEEQRKSSGRRKDD